MKIDSIQKETDSGNNEISPKIKENLMFSDIIVSLGKIDRKLRFLFEQEDRKDNGFIVSTQVKISNLLEGIDDMITHKIRDIIELSDDFETFKANAIKLIGEQP